MRPASRNNLPMTQEREQTMRKTILAKAFLALSFLGGAVAMSGGVSPAVAGWDRAYCLQQRDMGTSCAYDTYRQCSATASGLGAECIVNPRVAFGEARAEPQPRSHRRVRSAPRD